MAEYRTTREQCQAEINGVCSYCGGPLEPLETVDNANNPTFWPGCMACSRFDYGVDEKVFRIARKLVKERHFRPYSHVDIDQPGGLESMTGGAVSLVLDVLNVAKEIGYESSHKE